MTTTPDQAPAHTAKDGKGILITEPAMQQLAKLCGEQGEHQVLRVELQVYSITIHPIKDPMISSKQMHILCQMQNNYGIKGLLKSIFLIYMIQTKVLLKISQ